MTKKLLSVAAFLASISLLVVACSSSAHAGSTVGAAINSTSINDQQDAMQGSTAAMIAQTHVNGWFPQLSGPTAEMVNLKARIIRLNDASKIGYVYGLSAAGQVMAFWTIRGKVSSMGSQLTNTENVLDSYKGHSVVSSPGDDGTYGLEECAGQGIFFFTADTDALVEWCGPWMYSDAPLHLATAPIIAVTAEAPTTPVPQGGTNK